MGWFEAIILSIVEGFTEFLPVSSTGHLILTSHLLGIIPTDANKAFNIVIQLGAVFAVCFYERSILFQRQTLQKLAVSFIPTGIIGFAGKKIFEGFLDSVYVVCAGLIVGGLFLIFFHKWSKERSGKNIEALTYKECAVIGVVQSLALFPGVSRSAAALLGSLGAGLSRNEAGRYSFLLAVPTLTAASLFKLKTVLPQIGSEQISMILVSLLICFLLSMVAMKLCLDLIRRVGLMPFGVYRIILGVLVLLLI